MADSSKSLVSQKSSDSGLHIQLHPLVLLTVSDHITRHAARGQQGPIIGALLGQQNGREITLEHAFECNVISGPNGEVILPKPWFEERVKQFKDVHKAPALDLVGWWTTTPPTGPDASHLPIHRQILQDYNESAVFLAFHPSQLQSSAGNGGKLPLTIYESIYEGDRGDDGDKAMQVDGEEQQSVTIKFRELPYAIETGEAEMISVESVARSGGNAAVTEAYTVDAAGDAQSSRKKRQGKGGNDLASGAVGALPSEEEDLIASLNTRLNAVKTLESRISLIKSYLASLPSTYNEAGSQLESKDPSAPLLSHPILREINSLVSHLSLLTPQQDSEFTAESLAQSNDVLLVSVLGQLGQSIKGMRELGRKSAVVQGARQSAVSRKSQGAMRSRYEDEFFGSREGGTPGGMYGAKGRERR